MWSSGKVEVKIDTSNYKANTFGFYTINGTNVIECYERSTKESVCQFLQKIRRKNPLKDIILVLDNFASHKAKKTRKTAKKLGIWLVFLPPYSPDLNPIEYIWKSIKHQISNIFVQSNEELQRLVKKTFRKVSKRLTFARSWIQKFLPIKLKKLCI